MKLFVIIILYAIIFGIAGTDAHFKIKKEDKKKEKSEKKK